MTVLARSRRAVGRLLATSLVAAPLWLAPAAAEYVVVFADGRYLEVAAYRFEDGRTAVELLGGGELTFGEDAVRYVVPADDIGRSPEPPVAAAAAEPAAATVGAGAGPGEAWLKYADPRYVEPIRRLSWQHALDPALVAAVVRVESDFRPRAVSPKGAQGLMQLMPATARAHDVDDPFDPEQNLAGGTAYLSWLLGRYQGDLQRTLAAYNAGPGAVDRARGIPPYRETRRYVSKVLELVNGTAE